jgi:uncharacterized membrane protein
VSAGQLLLVVMLWAHVLATIVWLGGGAYSTLILAPQLRGLPDEEVAAHIRRGTGAEFGRWINAAIVVFIVSGVFLTFDRLANRGATPAYGIVLAFKVGLAFWTFAITQGLRRRRGLRGGAGRLARLRWRLGSPRLLLWLGAVIVLLAAVLKVIYEAALGGA